MKKTIIWIIILAVVLGGGTIAYRNLSKEYEDINRAVDEKVIEAAGDNKENAGGSQDKGPDFVVYDEAGNKVTLSEQMGKPIIINIWATWCGPCQSELPYFDEAIKEYGDRINFMMIDQTDGVKDTVESVKEFMKDNGYEFPVLYDLELSASIACQASGIPLTLFIDKDGNVKAQKKGALKKDSLDLYIKMLMKE